MTFRTFLSASYALLVETYLTIGPQRVDLLTALEKVAGSLPTKMEGKPQARAASQNDQALAQLQAMMAGVQKA